MSNKSYSVKRDVAYDTIFYGLALFLPFYYINRIGFMSTLKSNLGISSLDVFNFWLSIRFCQYVTSCATKKWHVALHFEDWLMDLIWFLFDVLSHLDIFHLQPWYIASRRAKESFSAWMDLPFAVNISSCLPLVHDTWTCKWGNISGSFWCRF